MYGLGAKRSPRDPRAYKYHPTRNGLRAISAALPDTFTLVPDLQGVRDQGNTSTCVAQSCACIAEYHAKKEIGFNQYCSPQFIYNNRSDYPSDGMYDQDAMNILKNLGVCREATFPFGSGEIGADIPAAAKTEALNFRSASYAEIVYNASDMPSSVTNVKKAIMDNGPVYVSFPV